MINELFDRIGLANTNAELFRNIVSIRISQDLFDDLSDDSADWGSAIQLESTTKPRLFISGQAIITRPFEEAEWNDAIGYPFKEWSKSRFSDGSFGVWYGANSLETTIHETVYHWRKHLLEDAGFNQPGIVVERRVYEVHCQADLIDLRPAIDDFPALIHPADYTFTQQIGARLFHQGHPGVITNSARGPGNVFGILRATLLSLPRQYCDLTYRTSANGVEVERQPGKVLLRIQP